MGLFLFLLGGFGYKAFQLLGFEAISSGIAAEAILILLVFGWTGTYLFRVFTGKMTFMEQRKRYRKTYEMLTEKKLQEKLDAMSDQEKMELIERVEKDQEK